MLMDYGQIALCRVTKNVKKTRLRVEITKDDEQLRRQSDTKLHSTIERDWKHRWNDGKGKPYCLCVCELMNCFTSELRTYLLCSTTIRLFDPGAIIHTKLQKEAYSFRSIIMVIGEKIVHLPTVNIPRSARTV